MGCSASKGSSRKRTTRESWYAPLSRSTSAPIRYVPEAEADDCHRHGSPSPLHTFNQRKAATDKAHRGIGTLALMLREDDASSDRSSLHSIHGHDVFSVRKRGTTVFAWTKADAKCSSKLEPVEEASGESDPAHTVELINTWELMKGLDEDGDDDDEDGSSTASTVLQPPAQSLFEKSVSLNALHGLDFCCAETSSPIRHAVSGSEDAECGKLGAKHDEITVKSRLWSPMRSPARSSPWRTPVQSPCSPRFDPALLAKFEEAIDASSRLPQEEWLLTQSLKEGSRTTSSSSSFNDTWASSEEASSSEGESPSKQSASSSTELDNEHVDDAQFDLESFEARCPPNGEDKVVLYFTSLRGVRKTYEECCVLRRILHGFGVYVDERDVWMHSRFRAELAELSDKKQPMQPVPRLFIKGRYIGGVEDVCRLHEDGMLARLMEGVPGSGTFRKACEGCAGVRFVPCVTCHGSCKLVDDEDRVIRCGECNENGLIMCPLCS